MALSSESPFLNLPLELRDQIYEYVALGSNVIIHPQNDGKPIIESSLSLVSRKISEELGNVLWTSAPVIRAYVEDFDFAHVIKFLDKLSALAAEGSGHLNRLEERTHRYLDIVFVLTPKCLKNLDQLYEWLKIISTLNNDHYMTAFTTSYSIREPTIAPITLMRIIDEVYCVWFVQCKPGPLKVEVGKVADILAEVETRENRVRAAGVAGRTGGGLDNPCL